jgi:DNA topoisomerase VI subunit B
MRELTNQTGHGSYDWPLVILKELIDNSLDACEEAEIAPVIEIAVAAGEIVIRDNGPGMPEKTIRSICNYNIRVSSREAYVSPSRGAQGNALKTILAMGYVLDCERLSGSAGAAVEATGETIIETRGCRHHIKFLVDHVTNAPRITHTIAPSSITAGTRITVKWPREVFEKLMRTAEDRFKSLTDSYTWLNPHLSLRGTWNDVEFINATATNAQWTKWRPCDPTSPHWYSEARLQRYLSAHVARDLRSGQDRPVREFIAEFRGLSGTGKQKAILAEIGASHRSLGDFFGRHKVNREGIAQLLAAMKRDSAPVKPKHLGIIGKEHLKSRFLAAGGAEETFRYQRRMGTDHANPHVVEAAFGLHAAGLDDGPAQMRRIVTGANWSVGIENPFRRFGRTGEGLESILAKMRANATQPVICALHLAAAHLQYQDRGKSSILLSDDVEATDV